MVTLAEKRVRLSALLHGSEPARAFGAHDALTARIAERNGFDAIWASGLGITASAAVPDASILTMTEFLNSAIAINARTGLPVIADCDSGFGDVRNVIHLVERYEGAGIAGICIEDKPFPKRNSFLDGQNLVPVGAFCGKIAAARAAAQETSFTVIARTEALVAGESVAAALFRARAYVEHGADAILIHSKAKDPEEIIQFAAEWCESAPLVVVPTTYPVAPVVEMAPGIRLVVYANQALRAAVTAMEDAARALSRSWTVDESSIGLASLDEIFTLQGVAEMDEAEGAFAALAEAVDGQGHVAIGSLE